MERYYKLLKTWCDRLITLQITELKDPNFYGGIMCPACSLIHGRIGDAVYPFTFLYDRTGERKYLQAAKLVVEWSENNVLRSDGGYFNDKTNVWRGTTVFSMIAIGDALLYHGNCLHSETYAQWTSIFKRFAEFVFEYFDNEAFGPNVNYYASESHAMALAYILTGLEKYKERAYREADYVKSFFAEDGLLMGEGHGKIRGLKKGDSGKQRTALKNCCFVDIGYNVEESLPSLISFAHLMKDKEYMQFFADKFAIHLEFMLPDGAWDNSWGSRADKWTYWGSRTSDGAQVGLCLLAGYDPVFEEAARRNFALYEKCSANGYLYGGRMYMEAEEDPCTHHSFCHAKALCVMLDSEFICPEACKEKTLLPRDKEYGVKYFPSVHVNLISKGSWCATLSDNEALAPGTGKGTSGGTVTMLWNRKIGPIFAATAAQYKMAEPRNMQYSRHEHFMPCGSLRLSSEEYESVNDSNALVAVKETTDSVIAYASGVLKNVFLKSNNTGYSLEYVFENDRFTVKATAAMACRLKLPVICSCQDPVSVSDNTVQIHRENVLITLSSEQSLLIEGLSSQRNFHVIGGFQTLPVYVELKAGVQSVVVVEVK